jgi:hypothetical protein
MLNSVKRRESAIRSALLILYPAVLLAATAIVPISSFADDSQRGFSTPQAAVDALVAAVRAGDPETAIIPILGPGWRKNSLVGRQGRGR